MDGTNNTSVEVVKLITEFLTENSRVIGFLIFLSIFRKSISNFISRVINFYFKRGKSEFGMNAASPTASNEEVNDGASRSEERPPEQDNESEFESRAIEEDWFVEMHRAFGEMRIDDAEAIFKGYAIDERNQERLEKNKAIYLYFRYKRGKDDSAINQLEDLARTGTTEESRFDCLEWLSIALIDSSQNKRNIKIWQDATEYLKKGLLVTKSIVNLAYALDRDDRHDKAKELLVDRIPNASEDEEKSLIFKGLSKIEASLANGTMSIYCKDKALEYDLNNRDALFDVAYSASNEDLDDISISNYVKLIRIDSDNSAALNNMGVQALEAGLPIEAIGYYKKAAGNGDTLAMANQGYSLLKSGLAEDAEKLAKQALEMDDVHPNIHSLIASINNKKEEQKEKWSKLTEKSINRQKLIRRYTHQYYVGDPKDLEGRWVTERNVVVNVRVNDGRLEASWQESAGGLAGLAGEPDTAKLTGSVSGSTFCGLYWRGESGDKPNTLLALGGKVNKSCLGLLDEEKEKLLVISTKVDDEFSVNLSRKKD